jgi:nucleotide-binding universal stress UspA family protein
MFAKVLVGYDGSTPSSRALAVAIEVAGKFGASLTVAVVRPGPPDAAAAGVDHLYPVGEGARALGVVVDEVRERATSAGATAVDSVVLHGETVEQLVDYLQRNRYDLAVVGSRGLTPGRRLLMGSVSSSLVDRAPCPVLVVRPSRRLGARGL